MNVFIRHKPSNSICKFETLSLSQLAAQRRAGEERGDGRRHRILKLRLFNSRGPSETQSQLDNYGNVTSRVKEYERKD